MEKDRETSELERDQWLEMFDKETETKIHGDIPLISVSVDLSFIMN